MQDAGAEVHEDTFLFILFCLVMVGLRLEDFPNVCGFNFRHFHVVAEL